MKISFILPLYNEKTRIVKTIREISNFRSSFPHQSEWIFVDDGSTDGTEALARGELGSLTHRWIRLESNQGKGRAVQKGMLEATGDFIFFTDADLSTPLAESEKLLEGLKDGYDIAIGSRGLEGSKVLVHQNWLRETMGKVFNRFARLFAFKNIRDSQCGFKAFKKGAAKKLFGLQKISGFSFDAEILYLGQAFQMRIVEVPVTWVNSKDSKVNIVRDSIKMLLDLMRIRWLHRNLRKEKGNDGSS